MSVPMSHRRPSKLKILLLAKEVVNDIMVMTANEKIFPRRNRWQCAEDLLRYSKALFRNASFANNIRISTTQDYIMRSSYQFRAKIYCRYLYDEFDMGIGHGKLSHKTAQRICSKLTEISKMINGWMKSDHSEASTKGLLDPVLCKTQIVRMQELIRIEKEFENRELNKDVEGGSRCDGGI